MKEKNSESLESLSLALFGTTTKNIPPVLKFNYFDPNQRKRSRYRTMVEYKSSSTLLY